MLMIDDAEAALSHVERQYAQLMAPAIAELRQLMSEHFETIGGQVALYDDYAKWVAARSLDASVLLSLDRLMQPPRGPAGLLALDVHRYWDGAGLSIQARISGELSACGAQKIILIDDAVYTGSTLEAAYRALSQLGLDVAAILIGFAKPGVLQSWQGRGALAFQNVEHGDILHLRDYFPLLPFSGRSTIHHGGRYRVAPLLARNGADLHLEDHPELRGRLVELCRDCMRDLAREMGKGALEVADLALISPHIALPLLSRNAGASAEEALRWLEIKMVGQ